MVLISTITAILAIAVRVKATVDQGPLPEGGNLDPKATASVKSIFNSIDALQPSGNARIKSEAVTACCGQACPIGLCNGRVATKTQGVQLNLAPTETDCCARSCPDGHCRLHDAVPVYTLGPVTGSFPGRPGHPGLPGPLFPGRPDSGCPGNCGRECGISCPCVCAVARMTSVSVDREVVSATTTTTITGTPPAAISEAKDEQKEKAKVADTAGTGSGSAQLDFELTAYFHTSELAGMNQDVLPIVVESRSKAPVTLLADIDLALTENYMSSFFLEALNLSDSTTALPPSTPPQEPVRLGIDGYPVTPHSTITLTFLAGPPQALKTFQAVPFNVFDMPGVEVLKGKWQPEVFLGVTFLRQAMALTLAQDFAGQGAVAGIPLLARDVVVSDAGLAGREGVKGGLRKDEL